MRPAFPFETDAPALPAALLGRFDRCAPREPALPPLADFTPSFGARELLEALARRGQAEGAVRRLPLHLAVRMPGEGGLDAERSAAALAVEAAALASAIGPTQRVSRVTLRACGDATAAGCRFGQLLERIASHLRMDAAEVVVEAHWPGAPALRAWRAVGITSLVLEAVRPDDLAVARDLGFASVTSRVACGRPGQDGRMLADELRAGLRAGATRVHLRACASTLESARDLRLAPAGPIAPFEDRGMLRARGIATLHEHGMRHIARGLFAPAGDALARARERDRLHLEVDGLSASPAAGTLAIGAGAFGRIGATCYRNVDGSREHARAVESRGLSVDAGVALSTVGLARRSAIASLVCHGRLDFEAIALAHLVEPRRCFARELRALTPLVHAGLVEMDDAGVELTAPGEHLVDAVIAVFEPGP